MASFATSGSKTLPNGTNPQRSVFLFLLKTSKASRGFLALIPSLPRNRFPIKVRGDFQGHYAGQDPEKRYSRLSAALRNGISDRYRLFLVESPKVNP
jgi:hypothetical protein